MVLKATWNTHFNLTVLHIDQRLYSLPVQIILHERFVFVGWQLLSKSTVHYIVLLVV